MEKKQENQKALMIAAPSSSSGKTLLSLALMRLMRRKQLNVQPVKLGPDYIDPAFHAAAAGCASVNIDPWAMSHSTQRELLKGDIAIVESMMGLFDGASSGEGSAASFAVSQNVPVVLVVDCTGQSHSVAALVHGFATLQNNVILAGVILNRVGSARHEAMLKEALQPLGIPVLAALPNIAELELPSRHLGLVQAQEHDGLEAFIERAADELEAVLDWEALIAISGQFRPREIDSISCLLLPPAQRICVAKDAAFSFIYQHQLAHWREMGAEISFFSPLADETPDADADFVFLPGGYPELHGAQLAAQSQFWSALASFAQKKPVYGECGGYMVLGEAIVDADGVSHKMGGLLPHVTSFQARKMHLGYRQMVMSNDSPIWANVTMRAHEFHYTSLVKHETSQPAFNNVADAKGQFVNGGMAGSIRGNVLGSYMHLICEAPE